MKCRLYGAVDNPHTAELTQEVIPTETTGSKGGQLVGKIQFMFSHGKTQQIIPSTKLDSNVNVPHAAPNSSAAKLPALVQHVCQEFVGTLSPVAVTERVTGDCRDSTLTVPSLAVTPPCSVRVCVGEGGGGGGVTATAGDSVPS